MTETSQTLPEVGRAVHHVGKDGTCHAAIVTSVNRDDVPAFLTLTVFPPPTYRTTWRGKRRPNSPVWQAALSAILSQHDKEPGTWHWPNVSCQPEAADS